MPEVEGFVPRYSTCPPECAVAHPAREHSRVITNPHVLGVLTGQVLVSGLFMGPRQELDGEMLDEDESGAPLPKTTED